jgi:acetyl esterase/lipase
MNSRHLVDPELSMALDVVPDVTVSGERLAAARATIAEMTMAGLEDADPSVSVSEHWAPGFNGGPDVRMVVYRPEGLADRAPVVLQIHGGGYIFGTAELGDPRNRAMARHVGCAVASVDYRLAPETPFPGGLDDCYAGLLWLHRQGAALNLDPDQIAVHGESAGGGIAAALAIMARDLAGPPIRFQMLTYPMLDDRPPQGGRHPYAGEFVWDEASNHYGWQCWLGREPGSPDIPPLAAPARVADLRGLPPTFIATCALDLFAEENLEYARRLLRAGVPTELYLAPGAFHGFDAMVPEAAVTRRFLKLSDDALRRALRGNAA